MVDFGPAPPVRSDDNTNLTLSVLERGWGAGRGQRSGGGQTLVARMIPLRCALLCMGRRNICRTFRQPIRNIYSVYSIS